MTWAAVLVSVVKIVIVIGFLLNMAAISVWADRRQSAMLQHRVGPNRAVVHLPAWLARVLLFGPAILVAGLVAIPLWGQAPGMEVARMTTGVQVAILVSWFTLLKLATSARRGGGGL